MIVSTILAALTLGPQTYPLAAAVPSGGESLVDCAFRKIDFKRTDVIGEPRRLVLLLGGARQGQKDSIYLTRVRTLDPSKLLMGHRVDAALFMDRRTTFAFETTPVRSANFRLMLKFVPGKGKWAGFLGLNGRGMAEEHEANSYMGECTITEPKDAVLQFETLERTR